MENNMNLDFVKVTRDDVADMTVIMKRAFDGDTRRHLGREAGGPPEYDNGEFITKWYIESNSDAYKVIQDGKLLGGFNVFKGDKQEYFLGNIFLDPDVQDHGYGSYIWKCIEKMYPDAKKWSTDTPGFSKRNHYFYINKCGFKLIRIDEPRDIEGESYILEKIM